MAFESGAMSFRLFYVPQDLPEDVVERFARDATPPINTLAEGVIRGWVSGRHLLDRRISADNAYLAGYLRLCLMSAERKIPASLFRAECRMEELARLQAQGLEYLKASVRSEIRKEVTDRMLPQMPPTLKGVPFVYDPSSRLLYAAALSTKQADEFKVYFQNTVGFGVIPVTPFTAAAQRHKLDLRDWTALSFSPDLGNEDVNNSPGQDFLTWLWFVSEARGGLVKLGDLGTFGVMIDGPLTFVMEGAGAHETVLRKGTPLVSAEAKTALLSGKKLLRARLTLARGEEVWQVALDAEEFIFRGLRVPESAEQVDAISRFQHRILMADLFQNAFLSLFDRFLDECGKAKRWEQTRQEIGAWIQSRQSRS